MSAAPDPDARLPAAAEADPAAPSAAAAMASEAGSAQPAPTAPAPPATGSTAATTSAAGAVPRWREVLSLAALVAGVLALVWSFRLQDQVDRQAEEWARRHLELQQLALESRTLSRQAEAVSRDMAAKMALLDARVAESAMQRTQLEELMQSLSRSRDENVLADIEAGLRVAQQQAALTGSIEPLALALRQTDERLARVQQPRLERVRRAALQDLDRVRSAGAVDITTLTVKLDEVSRQIDELPLLAGPPPAGARAGELPRPAAAPKTAAATSGAASAPAAPAASAGSGWLAGATQLGRHVWEEVRDLVRVTRVDNPEAALLAPEQAVFLRENLRLRLLNARLALLSRQFDTAQSDLRQAVTLLERYFDKSSRRVGAAAELLRQVQAQSRSVVVPRPDATLSAIAAATGGR